MVTVLGRWAVEVLLSQAQAIVARNDGSTGRSNS
jgi:hypothetical protein